MENVIGGALKLKKPIGGISKCVSVSSLPLGPESDGKTASSPPASPPFSARVPGGLGKEESGGARPVLCSCLARPDPSCAAVWRSSACADS